MESKQQQHKIPSVLVFDSGVGGLSITQALIEKLPQINVTYAADNLHFPYGIKTEQELVERIDDILHRFQNEADADLIVVACNTASTVALERIRERFLLPIVGVVPAIKPAAKLSNSKTIGLLATPGTVSRRYTDGLIEEFANDCHVIRCGSNRLVSLAELALTTQSTHLNSETAFETFSHCPELLNELSVLIDASNNGMDTIVLACTHFPLVKKHLQRLMPNVNYWVDSGEAIANRVDFLLTNTLGFTHIHTSNNRHPHNRPCYRSLFSKQFNKNSGLISYLNPWFSDQWQII